MFQALELSAKSLIELKEIAKSFSIDTKGLAKPDIILKIIEVQSQKNDAGIEPAQKIARTQPKEMKEKRPRKIVKLEPLIEEVKQEVTTIPIDDDINPETISIIPVSETVEEKEILRHIYNGEWDQIPESIGNVLKLKYHNNNMGEVIKVLMITSSGSEGINLRNTRYVHIMEPYWHPVRLEQVIGRARRICSHKALPVALQTVEVFVYLMIFSEAQLKSDEAIELKRKDLSKSEPKVPLTSDQYLYEICEIKANLTGQLTDAIKESAFDCYIYSNGKCVNFGDPTNNKFSYVPDYSDQQNDTTVKANKVAIQWVGKPVNINGVDYIYRRISNDLINIYDKSSYEAALQDPSIIPLQIGTLEKNERGENVFKQLIT
jgi:hypothetical protein